MPLQRHLAEDRLRDVVVAAPVGRSLGEGELVEEVPAALVREPVSLGVHGGRVVDPEDSIFYSAWSGNPSAFTGRQSRIEGIGRQRLEASFLPDIVDRMIQVPDAASIATMRLVSERTGRSVGGSTGTNVWGAFQLIAEMLARGERGSVVTLICDGGDRYAGTYYSDAWVADQGLELAPQRAAVERFLESGAFPWPEPAT